MRGEERADWRSDTAAPSASRDSGPCHWAACINAECAEWRARLGRQLRKILVVTAYTGTNASGEVLREIGISHQDLVASDPKAAARRFRAHNGLEASCSFDCIRELNQDGIGWCWRCLSAHCRLPSITPDLAVLGFPCRPYSRARTGSGSVDGVEQHHEFDLTAHALRLIARVRPVAALCENVEGFKPWVPGFCLRLQAEGYHVGSRKLSVKAWTDAASTRFYIFALDVKRAPRTALTRALEMVDALQAARGQRPPAPIQDALLVPGTWLWEQHVQPLVAPTVGGAAQPVGRACEPTENDSAWEQEAERLRSLWRSQGFEHHGARPWTEVPLNPPLLRGLPRKARVAEVVELGFLWASKKLGLSPLSAQDRPSIVANLFVDVSQNPHRHPWSYGLHRLTRNSHIYSYEHDRAISAFEAFRIYGWRSPCLEGLTTSEAWDLIGDSMALQTLAVSIVALAFGAGEYMPGLWEVKT